METRLLTSLRPLPLPDPDDGPPLLDEGSEGWNWCRTPSFHPYLLPSEYWQLGWADAESQKPSSFCRVVERPFTSSNNFQTEMNRHFIIERAHYYTVVIATPLQRGTLRDN